MSKSDRADLTVLAGVLIAMLGGAIAFGPGGILIVTGCFMVFLVKDKAK